MDVEVNQICTVCFEEEELVYTCSNCKQSLCNSCLCTWIVQSPSFPCCPICRKLYFSSIIQSLQFDSHRQYTTFVRRLLNKLNDMQPNPESPDSYKRKYDNFMMIFLMSLYHSEGLELRLDPELHMVLKHRIISMYDETVCHEMRQFLYRYFHTMVNEYNQRYFNGLSNMAS